jgi:hypothetical protein
MKLKLLFILLLPIFGFAQQQSTERIIHLYAIPEFNDNAILSDSIIVPDSTMVINVGFKIEDIPDISKVYINIGSKLGGSETVSVVYDMVNNGSGYELSQNGKTVATYGRNVYLSYEILIDEQENYSYIEIWAMDKTNLLTAKVKTKL